MRVNDYLKRDSQSSVSVVKLSNHELRKLQLIVLGIADDIAHFCERNNIEWCLGGGSALGAVRHGGFIPWDDDIDILMMRSEWNRFWPGFVHEFKEKYEIQSPDIRADCQFNAVKVHKRGTVLRELTAVENDVHGIFVDIFIIENVPDTPIARALHGLKSECLRYICSCVRLYNERHHVFTVFSDNHAALRGFRFRISIGRLLSFRSLEEWVQLASRVNRRYELVDTKMLSIPTGLKRYFGELMEKHSCLPFARMEFEGRLWKVPRNYEFYLTHLYGNWRQVPSSEEREQHVLLSLDFGD